MAIYFLWFVLLFISAVSTASAEIFVHSVNGSPTISMDGYFKDQPIEVGMYIHPLMKVQVSHLHNFRIHCGDPGEPVNVINSRQVPTLCKPKKDPDPLRSESDLNYPIIVSPRKPKVLALEQIEWGYRNASKYQLTITEFGEGGIVLVDVVISQSNGGSLYNTHVFHLSEKQKLKLKSGQKYRIVIKDISTGKSSERDPGFSGVVQLAEKSEIRRIENNLDKVKQTLDNDSLETYFSAIHLRNQKYYVNSTQLLNKTDSSVNPVFRQYLQVKNAQSEGVLINYMMKKWFELLVAAVKKDNVPMAALVCVDIRANYHRLSRLWLDFLGKYKNRETFKKYCDLTDL